MRVFLTGATGFIGSRIVPELLATGHDVIGMTRSEAGARALAEAGATPHHATLEDLDAIRAGAEQADSVIHTAFDHDFSRFLENCEKDTRVIGALGEVFRGSDRPIIITSGVGVGDRGPGVAATEDVFNDTHPNPRIASERAGHKLLDAGIDLRVMRLPQVHDPVKQGLISPYVDIAREKGVAAYIGEGANRWPAAHVLDTARLYVLALDKGAKGARYHAVAEEGIAARTIAETVARGLGIEAVSLPPEQAEAHFGWLGMFMGLDMLASSAWTRETLGWVPTGPTMIEDLEAMDYAALAAA